MALLEHIQSLREALKAHQEGEGIPLTDEERWALTELDWAIHDTGLWPDSDTFWQKPVYYCDRALATEVTESTVGDLIEQFEDKSGRGIYFDRDEAEERREQYIEDCERLKAELAGIR